MSTLRIDPQQAVDIDWKVGETYTFPTTGTVTTKTPDGGYNLNVTSVVDAEAPEELEEETPPMPSKKPTADMMMGTGA